MRLAASVLFAVTCASSAMAQTPSRAQLVLTILGGAVTGHSLWDVPIQPVAVLDDARQPTVVNDTVHLSRDVTSSIVAGASATYFFSPHVGVHAEISYLGLPFDDSCTGSFHPDLENKNQEACNDIQQRPGAGGVISLFIGATLRAASTSSLTPYIRGNIGIVEQPHSSVAMIGTHFTTVGPEPIAMIDDRSPQRSALMLGLALGLTTPISKGGGYQFRLEARDFITSFERVTGQANVTTRVAPTAGRSYHHFSLTLGLDVVLEKSRGRRY